MSSADIVKEKTGTMADLGSMDKDTLAAVVKEYYDRSIEIFGEAFFAKHEVKIKDEEIQSLEMEVNDMQGKFIIPPLKKVPQFQANTE